MIAAARMRKLKVAPAIRTVDVGASISGTRHSVPITLAYSSQLVAPSVARVAYSAGAVVGNDISGFADPDYLPAAAGAGATVVATHIRIGPRIPDPEPEYDDVVDTVRRFLERCAAQGRAAGISADRIVLDAGLDLGKTPAQSLELLRASSVLAGLGYPLLLSASNKPFLGATLGLDIDKRGDASLAAAAVGISLGCRIVRAHDVAATRRVCDALAAVLEAA